MTLHCHGTEKSAGNGIPLYICMSSCFQVDVLDELLKYKWNLGPSPGSSSSSGPGAGIGGAGTGVQPLHYGVLLAKSVGMPAHITDRARQIAEALEADQQQRVEHCSRESQALRQVWRGSSFHWLACCNLQLLLAAY